MEDFFVPAESPNISLFVRNKHPADATALSPDRIVLFVHGATYPSESQFDLPLGGVSWMDYIAERDWDVYAMDIRGYGRSTRPPEMAQPAADNPPIVGYDVAVADIGSVVNAIRARRDVRKISLIGWSWGATLMGAYAANNGEKVARLVLLAPGWIPTKLPDIASMPKLGAYRTRTEADALHDYDPIPADRRDDIRPRAWFDAYWAAQLASDPMSASVTPPAVRAPNGVSADFRRYNGSGHPYYEPERIAAPTLIITGEWDFNPPYMGQAIFARLTHAPVKRYVLLGHGTHEMVHETGRGTLFSEIQHFLEERQ
jgi:pimeloyl-ACP methyl ester carboxylesterase